MIDDAFNKSVDYYDVWIKKALPCYDGLFSWHILQRYRRSDFTLVDVADKMLAVAENRFADFGGQFSYVISDYREALPESQFSFQACPSNT